MKRLAAVLALAASACGIDPASSSGGGPFGTTIVAAGGSFPLSAAFGTAVVGSTTCPLDSGPAPMAYAVLIASAEGGRCGYLEAGAYKANARAIELGVLRFDPTAATTGVTPGQYPILVQPTPGTSHAFLAVSQTYAACTSADVVATVGVVTVTATAGGTFQGTVTAALSDGGSVSGAFEADACSAAVSGDICSGDFALPSPTCLP